MRGRELNRLYSLNKYKKSNVSSTKKPAFVLGHKNPQKNRLIAVGLVLLALTIGATLWYETSKNDQQDTEVISLNPVKPPDADQGLNSLTPSDNVFLKANNMSSTDPAGAIVELNKLAASTAEFDIQYRAYLTCIQYAYNNNYQAQANECYQKADGLIKSNQLSGEREKYYRFFIDSYKNGEFDVQYKNLEQTGRED